MAFVFNQIRPGSSRPEDWTWNTASPVHSLLELIRLIMEDFIKIRDFLTTFKLDGSLRLWAYQAATIAILAHVEHARHSTALLLVDGISAFESAWESDAKDARAVGETVEDDVWPSAECVAALDQLQSLLRLFEGRIGLNERCPSRRVPLGTAVLESAASCLVTGIPGLGSALVVRGDGTE